MERLTDTARSCENREVGGQSSSLTGSQKSRCGKKIGWGHEAIRGHSSL